MTKTRTKTSATSVNITVENNLFSKNKTPKEDKGDGRKDAKRTDGSHNMPQVQYIAPPAFEPLFISEIRQALKAKNMYGERLNTRPPQTYNSLGQPTFAGMGQALGRTDAGMQTGRMVDEGMQTDMVRSVDQGMQTGGMVDTGMQSDQVRSVESGMQTGGMVDAGMQSDMVRSVESGMQSDGMQSDGMEGMPTPARLFSRRDTTEADTQTEDVRFEEQYFNKEGKYLIEFSPDDAEAFKLYQTRLKKRNDYETGKTKPRASTIRKYGLD